MRSRFRQQSNDKFEAGVERYIFTGQRYGTDAWGRTWADTEFSNTNFRVKLDKLANSDVLYVDYLRVKVHYTTGGGGTATYYNHPDHLTGSNVVTDENGGLAQLVDYYPFGGIRLDEKTGTFDEQRKFTGHEYDEDTNLHYYVQRYYNQDVGRFTSQDPVHLLIGDDQRFRAEANRGLAFHLTNPQALNSYSYTINNPLKYVDEEGEIWDTFLDVGFIAFDVGTIIGDIAFNGGQNLDTHLKALAADTGAAAIPGVTGAGLAVRGINLADNVADAAKALDKLPGNTLVCRGGTCSAKNFAKPGEVKNGVLSGSSVNASPNASIEDLTKSFPQNQFGQTILDKIRALGGNVTPTPNSSNPFHADLNGITPQQAESLFTPTKQNPNKLK